MNILGIETSCDETAAAVYTTKRGLCSNVLFSQVDEHYRFGGVVPELASRSHIEKIGPIVEEALHKASYTLADMDVVAVTNRPGLPGSLLVGLCYAKALAYAAGKRLIGVNHLEGHIASVYLEHDVPFPHLCLTASGGHTALYRVDGYGIYTVLGQTADDAAGEAFDKVARLLGYGYPGGAQIEALAAQGGFKDYRHYPRMRHRGTSFSFSGIKTAVLYDLVARGYYDMHEKRLSNNTLENTIEVASSLLVAVGDIFIDRLSVALAQSPVRAITFVGGVAANQYLAQRIGALAAQKGCSFFYPSRAYCTDNAAMIAFVGHYKALQGQYDNWLLDLKHR